ncbi:hypothetical protein [Flavobacterium sp. PL002]|uniref:hypothetical protein n=1 Tax=Flavobacterium sp. PL002 TaxID=1897058 RepID=UPI001787F4DA|nr:hypothetical protein [Flavobacterium sp. PL002]MBE0391713.1 hypothetical protein [Flavobacterium sp. PL002]
MKKLVFLFAVTVASLASCSSDDNDGGSSNGGGSKLAKSEVTTTEPDGTISLVNYTYDGTKIATTSSSNSNKSVYTYNSNELSKIENKVNDITQSYTVYVFEKGDVKSTTTYSVSAAAVPTKTSSVLYTYDEAAKTQTTQTTSYPNGVPTVSNTTTVNTYDSNNLVKSVTTTVIDDKNDNVSTINYIYDTKTNYMVNVTGMPANIVKAKNNPVTLNTTVVVKTDNVIGTPVTTQSTFEYTYDDSSFPTEVKSYTGGKLTSSKVIFYN